MEYAMEKIKVLVVDDESRMRKLVSDFLTRDGYEVIEAGDGEEAVEIFFQNKDIAVILLDVMMPKMNGWQVLKTIREYSQVPVIMLTAKGSEYDVVMGLENRILYNLVDVLKGRCRMKQAVIKDKRFPNLSIIPSSCTKDAGDLDKEKMKQLLAELRQEYDYVLVDSPAGIDHGFELALANADHVILVTTPQIAAIHDADCVLQILKKQKMADISLLINGFRSQLVKDGDMLDIPDICELLEAELLGVVLEDEAIIVAQNHGMPVMGQHAAKGLHTVSENCYRNIARRITAERKISLRGYFSGAMLRRNVEIPQMSAEALRKNM